jgi:flavodoxin I
MDKIGIFYGPEKGSVEKVAQIVADAIGSDRVDLIPVREADERIVNRYNKIIFGLSTVGKSNWDSEYKNTDWDLFFPTLKFADWEDKTVAIFGLGNQIQYPHHFVDAMGWLYDILEGLRVNVVGQTPTIGYEFKESEGIRNNMFVGLPIDEDFEQDLTLQRVKEWVGQLKDKNGF